MRPTRDGIALKIVLSYLVLALLGGALAYLVYLEVNTFLGSTATSQKDSRIVRTSSLVSGVYQAENLSKKALQDPSQQNFSQYELKLDSLMQLVSDMKISSTNPEQLTMLDSITLLLNRKSENTYRLRELRSRNERKSSFDLALSYFDRLEADLGRITPQALAPNLSGLPEKSQQVIRDIAAYLNENIPESRDSIDADEVDSIVQLARQTLREARQTELRTQRNLSRQERLITENDLKLSEQLRGMVAVIEKEALLRNMENQREKELLWRKSRRLAGIAAIGGLILVILFTLLISRDFWRVQSYRRQLEREKQYSDFLLQSREQLIHTVSHDLRTPLQTIKGYGELLAQQGLTSKQKDWLKHMLSASGFVEKLVNDLLDLSSLQAGKMKCEELPFTMKELVHNTASEVQVQFPRKDHIHLDIQIDKALDNPVLSDPFRVRQILTNLLTNAFKFTKEGSIQVRAQIQDRHILINVRDTGIGIPEKDQESVFGEFTQAGNVPSDSPKGYGLGLAISRKLANLLGGDLSFESRSGEGSTFSLQLPLKFAAAAEVAQASSPVNSILIADDDRSLLQLLSEQCREIGIEARTFTAIDDIPADPGLQYDAILTDLQMPGGGGVELLERIKNGAYAHYQDQPVILMTGNTSLQASDWKDAGFAGILRKPFPVEDLKRLLGVRTSSDSRTQQRVGSRWARLAAFVEDETVVHEILRTYLSEAREGLAAMRDSLASGNPKNIAALAHKMLPMAKQLEREQLIRVLEDLEQVEGKTPVPGDISKAVNDLECALQDLESEVLRDPGYTG